HQSKHGAGLAQHQSKHGAGLAQHQSKHGAGLAPAVSAAGKPEPTYRMLRGAIDFVEPNERGIFKREEFEISDEEVEALEQLIIKTSAEILDLGFWSRRCGEPDCEYCRLRELMGFIG
ncbi:MAG: hypothetical protein HY978_04415, partial [Candidatus Liptonbacteria bacterium]|nr:hypothetical protein [Candidatus Liptonbacteria bacterium]